MTTPCNRSSLHYYKSFEIVQRNYLYSVEIPVKRTNQHFQVIGIGRDPFRRATERNSDITKERQKSKERQRESAT